MDRLLINRQGQQLQPDGHVPWGYYRATVIQRDFHLTIARGRNTTPSSAAPAVARELSVTEAPTAWLLSVLNVIPARVCP